MGSVEIRAAKAKDVAAILQLQGECRKVVDWSEGLWRQLLMEDDSHAALLRRVWVAEDAGMAVGFLVQGGVAEVAELEMVVVAIAQRGAGIGRSLCKSAMRWAAECGAQSMELEVRGSNEAALRLYESLGFVRQGLRRDYYRNPAEDAVLMSATLQRLELQGR